MVKAKHSLSNSALDVINCTEFEYFCFKSSLKLSNQIPEIVALPYSTPLHKQKELKQVKTQ